MASCDMKVHCSTILGITYVLYKVKLHMSQGGSHVPKLMPVSVA